MKTPLIHITPNKIMLDEKVHIRLTGFASNELVTLRAKDNAIPGGEFEASSFAVYRTDGNGEVDVAAQSPITGTYVEADPMGLFWSMEIHTLSFRNTRKLEEFLFEPTFGTISFTAEVNGQIAATAELTRHFISPDVKIANVLENGLAGRYFSNPQLPPRPGILVVGGSEGGLATPSQYAALFASHGYPALALAYFRFEHLPDEIRNIPLEYFQHAIEWMQKQDSVAADQIVVFGRSKGAELALVLAATFPEIRSVIASSPSSTVCIGSWTDGNEPQTYNPQSSWSYGGRPLPFINWTEEQCLEAQKNMAEGKRIDHIHGAGLLDPEMAERATIPVERINGPVLLLSSDDDHWWPATLHCQRIMERLKQFHFPHKHVNLNYTNTGHMLRFPYIPTTRIRLNGGTAKNNADASKHSWRSVLDFLKESFPSTSGNHV